MNTFIQVKVHVEDHFISSTDPMGVALIESLSSSLTHSYMGYTSAGAYINVVGQDDTQKVIDFFNWNGNSKVLLEFLNIKSSINLV